MRINLFRKRVVTESGVYLGRVQDISVEWPDLRVISLDVKKGLSSLMGAELVVAASAIVRLETDTIVVEDAVIQAESQARTFSGLTTVRQTAGAKPSMRVNQEE